MGNRLRSGGGLSEPEIVVVLAAMGYAILQYLVFICRRRGMWGRFHADGNIPKYNSGYTRRSEYGFFL